MGDEPPIRVCVKVINESSRDFIGHISPQSLTIKENLKLPLLMVTFSTGISSAINQAAFKFHGEVLQSSEISFFSPFELILLTFGLFFAAITMVLLNVSI